ncbi:MAG: branched-chain amino acid ABC transporter permease [Chromatiales bacterium]|nr:branched-chain amino acid ABC transporter permease [Chromatiales bacterium]
MLYRATGTFNRSYAEELNIYQAPLPKVTMMVIAVLTFVVVPLTLNEYYISILNFIGVAALGAIGLNILLGYTGQISVGHGGFMAVGAYTTAVILREFPEAPWLLALVGGGFGAAAVGMFFGIPSLRIKGLYLAVATLAAQLIIEWGINHWGWLSGGAQGSVYLRQPTFPWMVDGEWAMKRMKLNVEYYYLIFSALAVGIVVALNLFRTHLGRAFIAVRDRDMAAEIIGIDVFKTKLAAFGISSFYAGVTGGLYAFLYTIANVEAFTLLVSIQFLAMCVIGGLGSILGSVLGAAFVVLLPIINDLVIRGLGGALLGWDDATASSILPKMNLLVFGGLIMFFLIVEPDGLAKLWRTITNYFRVWPFPYI